MDGSDDVAQGELRLRRGSLMRIADGAGMLFHVWRGSVWITQEGDVRDRFVGAGGGFRVTRGGVTLIGALQSSVLSLTSPRESAAARHIDVVRAGTGSAEPVHPFH